MKGETFLNLKTIEIIVLGVVDFGDGTVRGLLIGKLFYTPILLTMLSFVVRL
jgi:Na+-transporting methylmalonyl-CoA/oxaloacetate decarboxylase beta subunit